MSDVTIKNKIAITFCIVLLFQLLSGCLGMHSTCPRCEGTGRDPGTLFFTECPQCGGDGEVGLLMDDEDTEDLLSVLLVIVIIILIIVAAVGGMSKKTETPPSQRSIVVPQPPVYQQPPQQPQSYEQKRYCDSCGREIPLDSILCPYCGKHLQQNIPTAPLQEHSGFCANCGKHTETKGAFCPYCGHGMAKYER